MLPIILLENFNEANLLRLPAKFYKSAKQYLNKDEIKKIQTAYSFAFYAHDGQDRMDGSKYITHPLAVATILLDLKKLVPTFSLKEALNVSILLISFSLIKQT